jgi:hypothetical protein
MPLSFRKAGIRHNWRADPLVRAGRPRPALLSKNQALATIDSRPGDRVRTRAPAPPFMHAGGIAKTKWHCTLMRAASTLVSTFGCRRLTLPPHWFLLCCPVLHHLSFFDRCEVFGAGFPEGAEKVRVHPFWFAAIPHCGAGNLARDRLSDRSRSFYMGQAASPQSPIRCLKSFPSVQPKFGIEEKADRDGTSATSGIFENRRSR